MTTTIIECACREPIRSRSYAHGNEVRNCRRCGRLLNTQDWHLTADGLRGFLVSAGEGTPEIAHDALSHFASLAIPRATEQGAAAYGMHNFLSRDIDHEAGEELLDVGNYCHMRALKDAWEVEQGKRDPEHAAERERHLMNLAAETIRLFEAFRYFASNY